MQPLVPCPLEVFLESVPIIRLEARVHTGLDRIEPDEMRRETMNGPNLAPFNGQERRVDPVTDLRKGQMSREGRDRLRVRGHFHQTLPQPDLHFICRFFHEGQCHDVCERDRVGGRQDQPDHALDQQRRLSRTGARRDDDIPIERLRRLLPGLMIWKVLTVRLRRSFGRQTNLRPLRTALLSRASAHGGPLMLSFEGRSSRAGESDRGWNGTLRQSHSNRNNPPAGPHSIRRGGRRRYAGPMRQSSVPSGPASRRRPKTCVVTIPLSNAVQENKRPRTAGLPSHPTKDVVPW